MMLLAGMAIGCGSDPAPLAPPADSGTPPPEDTTPATDTPAADVRPADAPRVDTGPVDAGTSRAGAACTMPGEPDPACGEGDLQCVPSPTVPTCSAGCENNASQAMERAQCGGNGSTCLTQGDPPGNVASNCTASCRTAGTTAATGACRAGNVCTGWWFTHAMGSDSTGCFPFCSEDTHCPMGMRCNARTGSCGAAPADATRLPDGSPCNPRMTTMVPGEMTARNIQCRGICFSINSMQPTQGICGSLMNIRSSTMCPDDPDNVAPRAPMGTDNLAICIWRGCTTNSGCSAPHICRFPEQQGMVLTDVDPQCDYPTAMQATGIAGDGGAPTDAATDGPAPSDVPADVRPDAPADAPADAPRTDGGAAG